MKPTLKLFLYAIWQSDAFRVMLLILACLTLTILLLNGIGRDANTGTGFRLWLSLSGVSVLLYYRVNPFIR